ncbi:MAG: hypothetical protein EHM91_17170, partial [Planctomycetota bacterium]
RARHGRGRHPRHRQGHRRDDAGHRRVRRRRPGVDVPVDKFIETAREREAKVIAMSCLLTSAFDSMKRTVAAVDAAGLRPATRVMVGGAPMTEGVCEHTGADGWGKDAVEAVELAKQWMGGS